MDVLRIYDNQETVDIFQCLQAPSYRTNLNAFFEEITVSLNKAIIRYENVISSGRF